MISDQYIHLNITFKNTVFLFHPSKLEMGLQGHLVNMQLLLGLQAIQSICSCCCKKLPSCFSQGLR